MMEKNNLNKDLIDIDIFVFGKTEEKKESLIYFFEKLSKTDYKYKIGIHGCLLSVFILNKNIIIQFILTGEKNPKELVNKFDFTILHSYYDGQKIISEKYVSEQIKNKKSSIIYKNPRLYRIIKYLNKGIKFNESEIFVEKYLTIDKYGLTLLMREKTQKDIYKQTNNLTNCDVNNIIKEYFGYNIIIDMTNIFNFINNDNDLINYHNIFERKLFFNDDVIQKFNIEFDYNKNEKSNDTFDYNKNEKSNDTFDYNKNEKKKIIKQNIVSNIYSLFLI